jgi:dienelactone hydrolase
MLTHLASHGFIVVVPQMYEPYVVWMPAWPGFDQEVAEVLTVLAWLPQGIEEIVGSPVRADVVGLAGHSRGGKVVWAAIDGGAAPRSLALVDPVDGPATPLNINLRVTHRVLSVAVPSLVIGCGLTGICAFDGDNHEQYFAAAASPAWHVMVPGYGHVDMVDDWCSSPLRDIVCASGPDRAGMRRFTGGILAAFFRATLQDDIAAYAWLTDAAAAPLEFQTESK